MAGTYACPTCQSRTTIEEGDAPLCVPCQETMVLAGATLDAAVDPELSTEQPIAPVNVEAYQAGLDEIEKAKASADTQEREYLRAKEYASKTKKRLEAAEATLRATVQAVADRLRPKPLFEQADHHSDEELVALLAAEHVEVTTETVGAWSDAERADARAWALAAHSDQPRLIPGFFLPTLAEDPLDPDAEVVGDDAPPEPGPESDAEPHRYPARGKKGRRRAPASHDDDPDVEPTCEHGKPIIAPCAACQAAVEELSAQAEASS